MEERKDLAEDEITTAAETGDVNEEEAKGGYDDAPSVIEEPALETEIIPAPIEPIEETLPEDAAHTEPVGEDTATEAEPDAENAAEEDGAEETAQEDCETDTNSAAQEGEMTADDGEQRAESAENTTESADSSDKKKKKKTKKEKKSKDSKKEKKPLTKGKKIAVIVTVVILVAAIIATSIAVPIVLANRGKIFVESEEDFANTDGNIYVLNKDFTTAGDLTLSAGYPIDFSGHTLIVSGDLKLESSGADALKLGNVKKKEFVKGGTLIVKGKLIVESPRADVEIYCALQTAGVNITAKKVIFEENAEFSDDMVVDAAEVYFRSNMNFNKVGAGITLNNCGRCDITARVNAALTVNNAAANNVNVYTNGEIASVTGKTADSEVASATTVNVNGGAITLDGNKGYIKDCYRVNLYNTSVCGRVTDCELLLLSEHATLDYFSVGEYAISKQLVRPAFIDVVEKNGGIYLTVAEGDKDENGAAYYGYQVIIDGNRYTEGDADRIFTVEELREFDITDKVNTVGKHTIKVRATALKDTDETAVFKNAEKYIDSPYAVYEYSYKVTLAMPDGIVIQQDEAGKYILSFNKVDFADYYSVYINGTAVSDKLTELTADVTEFVKGAGIYTVTVVAKSNNEDIRPSKTALYAFTNKQPYDFTTDKIGSKINWDIEGEGRRNEISRTIYWEAVNGAKYYDVEIIGNDGKTIKFTTSSSSFDIDGNKEFGFNVEFDSVKNQATISLADWRKVTVKIKAVANGYNLDTEVTFTVDSLPVIE